MEFYNKNMEQDTITAISTAPGGALAILRISGPDALRILNRITCGGHDLTMNDARKAVLRHALGTAGEPCLALYMPGPASFTGEDVAEVQCHGGDFAPSRLLKAALEAGARAADGGEFTRRAFLNGKLDLTQAEAVMDLISAKSAAAGKLAEHQMAGRLGGEIRNCRQEAIRLLAEVESRLDFPEEDLDWIMPEELRKQIEKCRTTVDTLLGTARTGALVRDGIRLVIAGSPNVGKSSLLNELLGYDRAIVTAVPGTTRDTLEEIVSVRGMTLRVTDTAGLHDSTDYVEGIGIVRSRKTLREADAAIWLLDASQPAEYAAEIARFHQECPKEIPVIVCWNKTDLIPADAVLPGIADLSPIRLAVARHEGLEVLFDRLEADVWGQAGKLESDCAVAARHAVLLKKAAEQFAQAETEIGRTEWELAASCLHQAVQTLGKVTGENAEPDILDEIFSRFCIGK